MAEFAVEFLYKFFKVHRKNLRKLSKIFNLVENTWQNHVFEAKLEELDLKKIFQFIEIVNLDSSDDSESEKGNAATKNNKIVLNQVSRPNKRKLPLVTDQARLNVIMDKNRSAYLREKFQLHQKNNSRFLNFLKFFGASSRENFF